MVDDINRTETGTMTVTETARGAGIVTVKSTMTATETENVSVTRMTTVTAKRQYMDTGRDSKTTEAGTETPT